MKLLWLLLEPGWYLGNFGESCTNLCLVKGLTCDANAMTDIDDDAKLASAALDAGVTCETFWDDVSSNAPWYIPVHNGHKNICEHLRNSATSSCETSYTGSVQDLQRFCYCK